MLDLGWTEMLAIAVVALLIIKPRDLPMALRTVGRYVAKIRSMAREFQGTIDEAVREAELDEVKNVIGSGGKLDVTKAVRNTIDPDQELSGALDFNQAGDNIDPTGQPSGQAIESAIKPAPTPSEPPKPDAAKKPVVARWPSSAKSDAGSADAQDSSATKAESAASEPLEQPKAGA